MPSFEGKIDKLRATMIKSIEATNNNNELTITTDDGIVVFDCYAECCSDSWIEHCESPSEPELFVSFENVDIPPLPLDMEETKVRDGKYMDCVRQYFYRLTTEKGSYLIEMRNNSNGYYGGHLE